MLLQLFAPAAAHKAVSKAEQNGTDDQAQQRDGLEAVPGIQRGHGAQNDADKGENEGLAHEQKQFAAAALQQQIDQERNSDGGSGAHTECEDEGGGGDIQTAEVESALLDPLGGLSKAQRQQNAEAGTACKDIGVLENRGQTDAGLHAGEIEIGGGVFAQQSEQRSAEQAGGDQIHTEEGRKGCGAFQNGGDAAAGFDTLTGSEHQQDQTDTQSNHKLEELTQGKLAGEGIGGGDAVHDNKEQQHDQRKGDALLQGAEAENAACQRQDQQNQCSALGGFDDAEQCCEKQQHRQKGQQNDLLAGGSAVLYADDDFFGFSHSNSPQGK